MVYVVGCYRSGTTLVERILASHPDATGLGFETLLHTHVVPMRTLPAYNARRWAEPLRQRAGVDSWGDLSGDRRDVFDDIARAVALEAGASVFVEKTPFHLFHTDRILAGDPDARVVQVVRDGRDVVTSILAGEYPLSRWPVRRLRLLAACALWQLFAWQGVRLADDHRDGRFLTISYEDVVGDPRASLDRLARFLGLDHDPAALLDWLERTREIGSNSSFAPLRGLSTDAVRRWRRPDELPPQDAALLDDLLASALDAVGYEAAAHPSAGRRRLGDRAVTAVLACGRVARFRANTARLPPWELWRYVWRCARPRAATPSGRTRVSRPRVTGDGPGRRGRHDVRPGG